MGGEPDDVVVAGIGEVVLAGVRERELVRERFPLTCNLLEGVQPRLEREGCRHGCSKSDEPSESNENLHTDAERHCARFILGVWNQDDFDELDAEHHDQLGGFDALRAVAAWDHAHRAAFAVWTLDPWWP